MYYLVSQEVNGGDQWYNVYDTTVTTTSVGSCDGGVYFSSVYPWFFYASPNHLYVPVDFKYTSGSSSPPPPPLAVSSPFQRMDVPTAEVSLTSRLKNGIFEVTLIGEPGQRYTIESSEDLQVWTPIDTVTLTGNTFTFKHPITTKQACRFYRAAYVR